MNDEPTLISNAVVAVVAVVAHILKLDVAVEASIDAAALAVATVVIRHFVRPAAKSVPAELG